MNKQQNKQETLNRWRDRTDEGAKRQLLAVHVYSQCGARGVRGAVFRDINTDDAHNSHPAVMQGHSLQFATSQPVQNILTNTTHP